jgi:DNA-binding MarR family transcriptional regulator
VIGDALRQIGIDIPTWRVLMILGEAEPRPVGQVARAAVINLSTLMRIVERMDKAGLITGAPSADDGRVTDLSLTAQGQDTLAQARLLTAPLYRKLIRGFSERDFSRLLDLLNRLHENLL